KSRLVSIFSIFPLPPCLPILTLRNGEALGASTPFWPAKQPVGLFGKVSVSCWGPGRRSKSHVQRCLGNGLGSTAGNAELRVRRCFLRVLRLHDRVLRLQRVHHRVLRLQ